MGFPHPLMGASIKVHKIKPFSYEIGRALTTLNIDILIF